MTNIPLGLNVLHKIIFVLNWAKTDLLKVLNIYIIMIVLSWFILTYFLHKTAVIYVANYVTATLYNCMNWCDS